MHHKQLSTAVLLFLAIGFISGEYVHKRKNWHERTVTEDELTGIPILGAIVSSFDSIVSQLTSYLTDQPKPISHVTRVSADKLNKLMNTITENVDKFTNESQAIVKKRDLESYNFTKVVDDNKSMNDYYKEKYASKYQKKFGMQVRSDEESQSVKAANEESAQNIREELEELKKRLGKELNVTMGEYGQELKKISGEFVERTKDLANGFKKQYKELTAGFIRKVKEEKSKLF